MHHHKKIVIKIGSNVLLDAHNTLDKYFLDALARQIVQLRKKDIQVILIVSGAVAIGLAEYQKNDTKNAAQTNQLLAGIGQATLIAHFWQIFVKYDLAVSQILLTKHDTAELKNILLTTLEAGFIPVLNENDVVSLNCFGGNDHLAAYITHISHATQLIILSNVDGLLRYADGSKKDTVVPDIKKVDTHILHLANSTTSKNGFGGMRAKLLAAKKLQNEHISTIITNGRLKNILPRIILHNEKIGTFIHAL